MYDVSKISVKEKPFQMCPLVLLVRGRRLAFTSLETLEMICLYVHEMRTMLP